MKPSLAVLYHFYYPDDVVSARHFQDLSEDLSELGWAVEVWPSNRSCRKKNQKYPALETYKNVQIKRFWRPDFQQESSVGRILNSVWMTTAWFLRFLFNPSKRPQVVLIGTDPVLGLIAAIGIHVIDSKVKIAHWCFDLYPEAAVADKKINEKSLAHRLLVGMMSHAYRACDVIVDLGSCMRTRLETYSSAAVRETLTPWAFYEPTRVQKADSAERDYLFGKASLGILYSGNFGLAHSADLVGQLAHDLAKENIQFKFSIRGHGEKEFRKKCLDMQWPISFAEFVSEEKLSLRLEAADIHIVSLKSDWTGTVVPSKFFGALAAGRPVIFEGSEDSAVARWIQKYELGWVLTPQSIDFVKGSIERISRNPEDLRKLQEHCHRTYQQFFSRQLVTSKWNKLLQNLV